MRKVVLVEPKSTHLHVYSRVAIPRLGVVLLGTILRNLGYDVRVYIEDIAPIDMQEVLSADVVGISTITSTAPEDLPEKVRNPLPLSQEPGGEFTFTFPPGGVSLEEAERALILEALRHSNWNQSRAAQLLRVPRHILLHRMEKFDIPWRPSEEAKG